MLASYNCVSVNMKTKLLLYLGDSWTLVLGQNGSNLLRGVSVDLSFVVLADGSVDFPRLGWAGSDDIEESFGFSTTCSLAGVFSGSAEPAPLLSESTELLLRSVSPEPRSLCTRTRKPCILLPLCSGGGFSTGGSTLF